MKVKTLPDLPHTISYVIRKRQQLDSLAELPKDKQPTPEIIWDGSPEDLDEWIDKVFDRKNKDTVTEIDLSKVEE